MDHGSVSRWVKSKDALKALALKGALINFFFPTLLNVLVAGGKKRTLAKGKKSQYHEVEGALKNWIVAKRNKRILLTKRMVVGKVQCLFFPKP